MSAIHGKTARFGAGAWSRAVLNDSNIPAGLAVGVALSIGSKVRWAAWQCQVPVNSISERMGVKPDYVRDVVELLVLLGYLTNTGETISHRKVYAPALPAQLTFAKAEPPTHETSSDAADAA